MAIDGFLPSTLRMRSAVQVAMPFFALLVFYTVGTRAFADQNYSRQVFFENSLSPLNDYYSRGNVSAPSTLSLVDGKLPLESSTFISGPNALKLEWKSAAQGSWAAELKLYEWRNRSRSFPGARLFLWLYAVDDLRPAHLPYLALRDRDGNFTHPIALDKYARGIKPRTWIRIGIPLASFPTASVNPFTPPRLNTLILTQGLADATPHALLIDDIRIENDPPAKQLPPPTPLHVQAKSYERHIDLTWDAVEDPALAQYVIYRSMNGEPFRPIGVQRPGVHRYCDYVGDAHLTAAYQVTARTSSLRTSPPSAVVKATTHPMTDQDLLTMVQEAAFRYYWEAAEPHSGMTRENSPGEDDMVAVGASGFGVMATVVAAERGFITHPQAVRRLLQITNFLSTADRFHGAWPHFLSGSTGRTLPVFDIYDNGADLVETSFMMEGLLVARQYFQYDGREGQALYDRITQLWNAVEWDWFRATARRDALFWHWSPDYGFHIANRLTGWNEVMITYLDAIASPTHGIPSSTYYTGWVGEAIANPYSNGKSFFGIKLDVGGGTGGPLFFTDYSFMGFDPRGLRDRFTDYFDNNRAQAQINRAYCIDNPRHWKGYAENAWGLTAADGPEGYVPYEPTLDLDDGTLAPTGAVSAFPYTPQASMAALKHYYRDLGAQVWSIYGFRDAFNLQQNWYSGITMGLNQAPMVVMIENYRTGLVWKNFMANPEIRPALDKIGFRPDTRERPTGR